MQINKRIISLNKGIHIHMITCVYEYRTITRNIDKSQVLNSQHPPHKSDESMGLYFKKYGTEMWGNTSFYLSSVWCWYHWKWFSICLCVCGSPELYSCKNPGPTQSRWESATGTPLPPFSRPDETLVVGNGRCSSHTASFSLSPSLQSETAGGRVREESWVEGKQEAQE